MKGLIQRVAKAAVAIDGETVGAIDNGILLLLGIEKQDTHASADKLLSRVVNYRIFNDQQGKMNRSLLDCGGGLLVVSQFTLVADTRKGLRPSFSSGAAPQVGEAIYNYFVEQAAVAVTCFATGRFGADMAVSLVNDGPVTFMLDV